MKLDTYLDLCTQVYEISKPEPPKDAYDFYLSYAKEVNGPILEPMCGTGRFLLPMLAAGFKIEGFDASDAMLNTLHAKARAQNLKPNAWQGFVESTNPAKKYSLIFIPTGSFGLITDLQAIKISLQTIYSQLTEEAFRQWRNQHSSLVECIPERLWSMALGFYPQYKRAQTGIRLA